MNTEFSDQEMVELLRGAAQVLPGTRAEHVAAAGAAGRRMRRRRRAASVIGTGTAGLVVVVGVSALGLNPGSGTQTVVQPAAPAVPSGSPGASQPGDGFTAAEKAKAAAAGMSPEEFTARDSNIQLLLDTLGPDFRLRNSTGGEAAVMVRDGSPAASALPKGWLGGANIGTSMDDQSGASLSDGCKPGQEKGTAKAACTSVNLANGRTVYVQTYSASTGKNSPSTTEGVRFYGRADGMVTQIMLEAWTLSSTEQSMRDQAVAWLGRYTDTLTALAADDRIAPKQATTGSTPPAPVITSHDRDLAVMQRALGINFAVLDAKVSLEPNWPLYKELPALPHGNWAVVGDITSITRSAFDAACTAKVATTACEKRTVDGNEVYVRTWADQDTTGEFAGESAAYFIRPDGRVILANLALKSDQLDHAKDSAKVAAVRDWLSALESNLIQAITDPGVKG